MAGTFLKHDKATVPKEERTWAKRAHLTTLLTYPLALVPLPFSWVVLGVIGLPFSVWLSRKKSSFSARQALEAIYLQSILAFGYIGFGHAFSDDRVLLVFSYIFMSLTHIVLLGYGMVKVSLGRDHNYPFSFIPYLFRKNAGKENWKELSKAFKEKAEFLEFKESIAKLDQFRDRIQLEVEGLNQPDLRFQGRKVLESITGLRESLLDKPNNYRISRQYLNYFPKTTAELLEKYNRIHKATISPDGEDLDSLKRNENLSQLMDEIHKTTEDVRGKIYASESLALDVEISAMKKNIDYGGY